MKNLNERDQEAYYMTHDGTSAVSEWNESIVKK